MVSFTEYRNKKLKDKQNAYGRSNYDEFEENSWNNNKIYYIVVAACLFVGYRSQFMQIQHSRNTLINNKADINI